MFAIIAAIIMFLVALGAVNDGPDVRWSLVAVAFFFLHFGWDFALGAYNSRRHDR
jgi:hypothetical protein